MIMSKKNYQKLSALYAGGIVLTGFFAGGIGYATFSIIDDMKHNTLKHIENEYVYAAEMQSSQSSIDSYLYEANNSVAETINTSSDSTAIVTEPIIDESILQDKSEHSPDSDKAENVPRNASADETKKYDNKNIKVDDDGKAIYYVQKGDTLSYVSSVTGYSVDSLAEYNGIYNVNVIYAGSAIRIPLTDDE